MRVEADGRVEAYAYNTTFGHDSSGSVTSIKDATNRTTTIEYDAAGHRTSVTDNAGRSRSMVVNALGWVQSTKDALLHETTYTYDAVGRLTSTKDAANVTRYTEYDAEGRVVASVDGPGKRRLTKYDAAGRVAETVDEAGYSSTVGYCADVPQPCATVDALGRTTLVEFDSVGRVVRQTDEGGRVKVLTYDTGGRLKSEDGPMQPSTDYQYNATTGLLQTVTTPAVVVTYGYDVRGNRTSVTALNTTGSQVTTYTYDLANRLLTETNPLLKVTTYTYDAAGSRATKLDANGVTTTYSYDDNRQLLSVSFGDGTSYTYEYDELGRRTKEKGPSHERTMAYDAVGRVKLVTDVTLGVTIDSEYDADGHRTLAREGGVDRRFEYDDRGFLKRAKLGVSGWLTVGHDEVGRRSFITRPNGVRSDWAYDEAGQLLSVLHKKGTATIEGFAYEYDTHGLRVSKTRFDGSREVYGYDGADRLIRVDYGPNRTVEYTLDNLGNRTREVETNRPAAGSPVVTTTTGTFNSFNQLTSRIRTGGGLPNLTTTYAYDNNGNTLSETAGATVTTYTWDRDNRLRGVSQPTPPTSYAYDANGLRISRVDGTGTTRYLLDGLSVLAEADGAGATTHRYLNNPEAIDDILAFEKAGAAYYPLTDALGSVTAVADSDGAVVTTTAYEVYGARSATAGPMLTDTGFTGRWHDANGLIEHRDRQRRPQLGGWLRSDRAGHVDGPNTYLLVKALPTSLLDQNGLRAAGQAFILVAYELGGWIRNQYDRTLRPLTEASRRSFVQAAAAEIARLRSLDENQAYLRLTSSAAGYHAESAASRSEFFGVAADLSSRDSFNFDEFYFLAHAGGGTLGLNNQIARSRSEISAADLVSFFAIAGLTPRINVLLGCTSEGGNLAGRVAAMTNAVTYGTDEDITIKAWFKNGAPEVERLELSDPSLVRWLPR